MWRFLQLLFGAVRRVVSLGLTQAQAVAFNMFLAFFPMLLLALGVLTSVARLSDAAEEFLRRLRWLLPPGSRQVVVDYLVGQGGNPQWVVLGAGGTLLVGTQVMTGLIEGFRLVSGDSHRASFLSRQFRALVLLVVTVVPFLTVVILTVFGRQVRDWMVNYFGLLELFHTLWVFVYVGLALVMALLVLVLVYRVGCRESRSLNDVVPGALLATVLWAVVNAGFGYYVRHVPYGQIYGGLAAAIGLMIWMYLSVLVVFLGAAYNAEAARLRAK